MPDNPIEPSETKGQTFKSTLRIDERGVPVGDQVYFNLSRADFILLTKVWSRLLFWAQFALVIAVTRVLDISSKSLSAHKLIYEPWEGWFVPLVAGISLLLFIAGQFVFNPKRKILRTIKKYFEEYE